MHVCGVVDSGLRGNSDANRHRSWNALTECCIVHKPGWGLGVGEKIGVGLSISTAADDWKYKPKATVGLSTPEASAMRREPHAAFCC